MPLLRDFRINGIQVPYPVLPYVWIPPRISGYAINGRPLRQGKPSCKWGFSHQIKTQAEDWIRSFLAANGGDNFVVIRTLDPNQPGYTFVDFSAWMHVPEANYERPILNTFTVLFTNLERV